MYFVFVQFRFYYTLIQRYEIIRSSSILNLSLIVVIRASIADTRFFINPLSITYSFSFYFLPIYYYFIDHAFHSFHRAFLSVEAFVYTITRRNGHYLVASKV